MTSKKNWPKRKRRNLALRRKSKRKNTNAFGACKPKKLESPFGKTIAGKRKQQGNGEGEFSVED